MERSIREGLKRVGGVAVVRYGFNPLEAIKNVKQKIDEFDDGLPTKAVVDYRKVTREQVESYAAATMTWMPSHRSGAQPRRHGLSTCAVCTRVWTGPLG